ncbi:Trehalase [Thalictrum thalictroides]|uniref:Trehalase n=1 Tax=Thalictrum thalictroides TaxID=46969 RepID=A0A7J6VY38_THATH|nr:Trehalase [Thalictrum thalictroides]
MGAPLHGINAFLTTNQLKKLGDLGLVAKASRSSQIVMFKPPPLIVMFVDNGLLSGNFDSTSLKFFSNALAAITNRERPSFFTKSRNRKLRFGYCSKRQTNSQDKETASKLLNVYEKQHLYQELASTAESGWHLTARWMSTTSIVPVDLNAYILKMELDIAFLTKTVGDNCIAKQFLKASEGKATQIENLLILKTDWKLYDPLFWNISMFKGEQFVAKTKR